MSRYIDADALMKEIMKTRASLQMLDNTQSADKMLHGLRMVEKKVEEAPSIDIVRCKECRHWHREIDENGVEYVNFSKCTKGHYGNGLDFHCADGERREP